MSSPSDRRRRLSSLHEVGETLRSTAEPAPDLASQILDSVDERRPFMDAHARRYLWILRGSIVCFALLVVACVSLLHQFAPSFGSGATATPSVGAVVSTAQGEAADLRASITPDLLSVIAEPSDAERSMPDRTIASAADAPATTDRAPSYTSGTPPMSAPVATGWLVAEGMWHDDARMTVEQSTSSWVGTSDPWSNPAWWPATSTWEPDELPLPR